MREVEFLPPWYVEQRRRVDRRAAQSRVLGAAVGCGLCMSAAVVAMAGVRNDVPSGGPAPVPARAAEQTVAPTPRSALPAAAANVLDAIDRAVPPGLTVTALLVHSKITASAAGGATVVEVRGVASGDALPPFVTSLQALPSFRLVELRVGAVTAGGNQDFSLSLHVPPAAARRGE